MGSVSRLAGSGVFLDVGARRLRHRRALVLRTEPFGLGPTGFDRMAHRVARTYWRATILRTPMANAGIVYDKYAVIQTLQKRGFSHEQAEGIAEVLTRSDVSQLATKLDLEKALHRQTWGLVGVIFAQAAFVITVLQMLG